MCRPASSVRLKQVLSIRRRGLATSSSNTPFQVFNSETKRHQRNRAAVHDPGTSRRTDYLRDEVASRLIERFMVYQVDHTPNNSSLTDASRPSLTLDPVLDIWPKP